MTTTYPRVTTDGRTVWACCESSIGPACQHTRSIYADRLALIHRAHRDAVDAGVAAERGLRASILTGPYNAPNDGLSAHVQHVVIVGIVDETNRDLTARTCHREPVARDWQHSIPSDDSPPVVLVKRRIGIDNWTAVPADIYSPTGHPTGPWYMASGAHITADSRLRDLIQQFGAIGLHDRRED